MSLDRSKAPEYRVPEDFDLVSPCRFTLANGATLFFLPTPGLDAVKLEVMGKSQRIALPMIHTLVPSFTLHMLQEGTKHKNAEELANFFDFHATEVSPMLTYSHDGLSLLTTRKHLHDVLPVYSSLFTEAIFPQEMLEKRLSQKKLSLRLEREKSSSRASQLFRSCLFGAAHPYGAETTENHVDVITVDLLRSYYENLLWQELEIFLTGDFTDQEVAALCSSLGSLPNKHTAAPVTLPDSASLLTAIESREKAVQSSIRIGGWSIPKSHPDFIALSVFNTILGGYFGSRLIKNIREDKGHTYGIYATLAEIGDLNYWFVSADVKKEFYPEVIEEIYGEIRKLTEIPLDMDELEVVRNYMIGQMLSRFSSSFDLMDRFRAVHHSGLDFGFYEAKLSYLKTFTADDMLDVGKKYFGNPPFIEVVVG